MSERHKNMQTIAFPFLFLMLSFSALSISSSSMTSSDMAALIAFKSACSDPTASLSSWTSSSSHPCSGSWHGISCFPDFARVHRIVLESVHLSGDAMAIAVLSRVPFLSVLSLKNNSFSGMLHAVDLSPLAPHLKLLYLSGNRFSGHFPESILQLRHLHRLELGGNRLTGPIPSDIGHRLPALLTLRLEGNSFTGCIPVSLAAMARLKDLDVADNHLTGEIPGRLAVAFPTASFTGNADLCGHPLSRRCKNETRDRHHGTNRVTIIIGAATAAGVILATVAAALGVLWLKKDRGSSARPSAKQADGKEEMVRFEGCLDFEAAELMKGAAEMLGKGAVGTTYRVAIGGECWGKEQAKQQEMVVVKRVRRREEGGGGEKDEKQRRQLVCEMGAWRHPNVVNLRAYYALSAELLLVVDYLPGGSLHSLLHGCSLLLIHAIFLIIY